MNQFRLFMVAALLAAVLTVPAAFAQNPANIIITSGNGQVTCPLCTNAGYGLQNFEPFYVRVTDVNGNPAPYATVNWTVITGQGYFSTTGTQTASSTTDASGNTNIQYILQSQLTGSSNNPYVSNTITASIVTGATVNFYETQALVGTYTSNVNVPTFVTVENETPGSSPPCAACDNPGDTLTGAAGSTSAVQVQVVVYVPGLGSPIPNVSLRLISNQATPSASCATGAGADPGSVLTGANGVATCTVVFGPGSGKGSFYFLVGGVTSDVVTLLPVGFFSSGNYNLNVLPGVPGMISLAGGNGQAGNPGQALSTPLVATVGDATGNPLAGQNVVWTVSPAGAATLTGTTTTSNSAGQVQTNVTLANSASGAVQVKAALVGNPNIFTTFTVFANVQVSGLQIVSGNSQTAILNAPFALPLVVQLSTSNGSPTANLPVSFSVSGPATISTTSGATNSLGQAQATVTAGSTAGTVTVTATSASYSATFTLAVIPQGPTLTTASFVNGADFQQGSLSPCSIATIMASGIAPAIQGAVAYDGVGGLPYTLAGDTVTFSGAQAPIYNVANVNGQQQLTFQVPCSVTPGSSVPVTVNVGGGSASINIPILPASPGLFTTQLSSTVTVPVLERPDGSFVSILNPARRGETLIAYVTGLGATSPSVATNSLPVPGSNPSLLGTVIVGVNGNGVPLISATLTQNIVGVYQVAFQVPSNAVSGAYAGFSIGVLPSGSNTVYYSTLGLFPVQ